MTMLSLDAQATLLLTADLDGSGGGSHPLTLTEWGRLAAWLKQRSLRPGNLLSNEGRKELAAWGDDRVSRPRLENLLGRGVALALAVEAWQRAGLWVMTRSAPDYPRRLKALLGARSPTVLFGSGPRALMSAAAIAVVGSRRAGQADLESATRLGAQIARAGYCLVSGGARGIDQAAMAGALDAGGQAVGVLADSLLKAVVANRWRAALQRGALTLISPEQPKAGFTAGRAMARNRYVYCLAQAAVVVHSGTAGGTWSGAMENLRHGWVPLWVKRTGDPHAGNATLVANGGVWLPDQLSTRDIERLSRSSASGTEAAGVEVAAARSFSGRPAI
jgi:predicted Rossmann fold nucleotide-binding protein DprA/Smf involved in DNA uptake